MKIESSAFKEGAPIPRKYTCDGENVSPPLSFHDIPKEAKTLALVVDDPDAPMGVFDHWIAWNIAPNISQLSEGSKVPSQGTNHFGNTFYKGPCPPKGPIHHYHFKLFALDASLSLPHGSTKEQLQEAMHGHIIEQAQLIGTYQR